MRHHQIKVAIVRELSGLFKKCLLSGLLSPEMNKSHQRDPAHREAWYFEILSPVLLPATHVVYDGGFGPPSKAGARTFYCSLRRM